MSEMTRNDHIALAIYNQIAKTHNPPLKNIEDHLHLIETIIEKITPVFKSANEDAPSPFLQAE
jgi:hypothetical protein